jgi:hypothetical protein
MNHDEFFKKNCFFIEYKLPNNILEALYNYSTLDIPLKNFSEIPQKLKKIK